MNQLVWRVKCARRLLEGRQNATPKADSAAPKTVDANSEGLCLISKNPNLILKSAGCGRLQQFCNLYDGDNSRIHFCDKDGRYACHHAAAGNHTAIIDYIGQQIGVFALNVQDATLRTPLHVAVEKGAVEALESLLLNGADANSVTSDQYTPFHLAVVTGQIGVLNKMAEYRHLIDVHSTAQYGRGALHLAAIFDQAECARVLLTKLQLRPDEPCHNGFTAIHEASRRASSFTLREFIQWGLRGGQSGAQLLATADAEGRMPLHLAVHSGHADIVRLCLKFGATIDCKQSDRSTAIHLACVQGNIDIIQIMLQHQPDERWSVMRMADSANMTPMHYAAKFDHHQLIAVLCQQETDIDVKGIGGHTPLTLGAMNHAWRSMTALLSHGADTNHCDEMGRTFLHYVVLHEGQLDCLLNSSETNLPCIPALVHAKDRGGHTPLHLAAQRGHTANVSALVNLGARLSDHTNDSQTPLHLAARYGHHGTVRVLVTSQNGALIINVIDTLGKTALHTASEWGQYSVVELLLKHGALLTRDFEGHTPLHLAAAGGYTETVALLLRMHKHIIDVKDKSGRTALHWASVCCRTSTVHTLLSSGCRLLEDTDGLTAIDLCIGHNHREVARVMFTNAEFSTDSLADAQGVHKCKILALIEFMPQVMAEIMDAQLKSLGQKRADGNNKLTDNLAIFDTDGEYFTAFQQQSPARKPTPLLVVNMMVKHGRSGLLMHPLTQKYLEVKWRAYGRFFHTVSLSLYMLFVLMLTVQSVNLIHELKLFDANDAKASGIIHGADNSTKLQTNGLLISAPAQSVSPVTAHETRDKLFDIGSLYILSSLMIAVCAFSILNIMKIFFHMWHQGRQAMKELDNYMELVLYGSAMVSGSPVLGAPIDRTLIMCSAAAVFLAWFNLLLQLRSFNTVGLYVVMFLEIQKTMLKVLATFSVLVVAFACSFYICMSRGGHPEFSTILLSMLRMFTMMLGELDFLTVFVYPWIFDQLDGDSSFASSAAGDTRHSGPTSTVSRHLPYVEASLAFLSVFMVMMPLLLMNLLVGLAVGDIAAVQNNAAMKRMAMLVDVHTSLERKLPRSILDRMLESERSVTGKLCCNVSHTPGRESYMLRIISFLKQLFPKISGSLELVTLESTSDNVPQSTQLTQLEEQLKNNTATLSTMMKFMEEIGRKLDIDPVHRDNSCFK